MNNKIDLKGSLRDLLNDPQLRKYAKQEKRGWGKTLRKFGSDWGSAFGKFGKDWVDTFDPYAKKK